MNALARHPVLVLARRVVRWIDTCWCLREVYRKKDYLGDDLPKLVINERELRP